MRFVTFRRLLPIAALLMLLPALLCTETAEVWCRVAVGATMDTDDDDGAYFTSRMFSSVENTPHRTDTSARSLAVSHPQCSISATNGGSVVDEPTFSLPHSIIVPPDAFLHVEVVAETIARTVETRGPRANSVRFARPPPRAPPVS